MLCRFPWKCVGSDVGGGFGDRVRDDVGGDDGDRMNIIRETRRPTPISNDSHYQFDDTT